MHWQRCSEVISPNFTRVSIFEMGENKRGLDDGADLLGAAGEVAQGAFVGGHRLPDFEVSMVFRL